MSVTNRSFSLLNINSCLVGSHYVCTPPPIPRHEMAAMLLGHWSYCSDHLRTWCVLLFYSLPSFIPVTMSVPVYKFRCSTLEPMLQLYSASPIFILPLPSHSIIETNQSISCFVALRALLAVCRWGPESREGSAKEVLFELRDQQDFYRQRWRERIFQKETTL